MYDDNPLKIEYNPIDFEEPINVDEPILLKEDLSEVIALEEHLAKLEYVLEDIGRAQGMSRSIAIEAHAIDPSILTYPLNAYTVAVTQTHRRVSVESIWTAFKQAVRKIIEKVREYIRRFINWVCGFFNTTSSDSGYEKTARGLDEQQANSDDVWQKMVDHMQYVNEFTQKADVDVQTLKKIVPITEVSGLDQFIAHIFFRNPSILINNILKAQDPFIHDFVLSGPYCTTIFDFIDQGMHSVFQLREKVALIKEIASGEKLQAHEGLHREMLAEYDEKIMKPVLYSGLGAKQLMGSQITSAINKLRESVTNKSGDMSVHYAELVLRMKTNFETLKLRKRSHQYYSIVKEIKLLEHELELLLESTTQLEMGEVNSPGNNAVVSMLRRAVFSLSNEVSHFMVALRYAKMQFDLAFYVLKETLHFSDTLLEWFLTHEVKTGVKLPSYVVTAIETMKRKRNTNYAIYQKYRMSRFGQN